MKKPTRTPREHYRIFLNRKGVIELEYVGPQTPESVDASMLAAQPLIEQCLRKGRPANFLIDYARMGKTTIAANQRALKAMRELTFHKMAGINAKPVIRFITNAIAKASRNSNRAQHFKTREEAERWLFEKR